jgi:hypothetical protein
LQSEHRSQNDAGNGRWNYALHLDDAEVAACIMIWLIKIPLVILIAAWAIWLY